MSTYIKEVILENFISHEYSRIPLNKGINLITGPNGCGKSSILLGISVALGQTYTERARKLSDLITYGKDVARVSLIMDNTPYKGRRPFAGIKLDQVLISRIIRKDGTYWFELNNEIIDKNYLQKLLKRLGIDPDNMLIIMHQNMIEQFVLTNPMERLKLVEEVIGIYDYRKMIENSFKKLEDIEKSRKGIEETLKQAEKNLNYWKKLYNKYERKKKLIEKLNRLKIEIFWAKYKKINEEYKELNKKLNHLEKNKENLISSNEKLNLKIKNLKESFLKIKELKIKNFYEIYEELLIKIEEYANLKSNYLLNKFKIELIDNEIKKVLNEINKAKKEIETLEKKKPKEFFEVKKIINEIENEIKDVQFELKILEDITEEIPLKYKEYLRNFEDSKIKANEIKENREKMLKEINERISFWKNNLMLTIENINKIFQNMLSKVEGVGSLEIKGINDFKNASLEIKVGFKGSIPVILDSFSQSGGERTVTTLAFLMSLQQYMKSTIRAIDEFDIHMDPQNKERAAILLSSLAEKNPNIQYLFITPDPMLKYFKNCNVIIVTKQQGISQINKLI